MKATAHEYDVRFDYYPGAGVGRNVVPACTCGWTGTPVNPTTLGDPTRIRAALHQPYLDHKQQQQGAA